ncbi:ATP-dependent sacrificial sulfur transferase LarE [Candidatus Oleimmundimicrobium sp.]|uniref:ATP-dependent sacrificial sulfur transferase LarE n=1 Tax=Candidatus Oleimmundimicrobium sp. TaxID=3060597 RepID=UPI0027194298|nr:ATP-dependent sacrificial sulfur transferase LarE [Candidatus Oleimmundimicrobium sp.]MDO8886821.1 ATP-dependent sacrificial sulfur transferase LarE [Candidatus Oleimmundimicrobium sp.]
MSYRLKYKKLYKIISSTSGVAVAFSGGVDSLFVLKTAKEALGKNVLAITGCLDVIPKENLKRAKEIAEFLKVKHLTLETDELKNENFLKNTEKRCYFCKQNLYKKLKEAAKKEGFYCLLDGTNADDENEFRPGRLVAKELGIISPLVEVGFGKKEIRKLLKESDWPDWDKPSETCLATRVFQNEIITAGKLQKIDEAEDFLKKLGLKTVRVRIHGEHTARIETNVEDIPLLLEPKIRNLVWEKLHKIGFIYTSLDLKGYNQKSTNKSP